MRKHILALVSGALAMTAMVAVTAQAADDDITKSMIVSASGDSWNVWGGQASVFKDDAVQAGKATRVSVNKGANPWDAQASVTINKPLTKGDVILGAYWARVATPPAGKTTATVNASIGLNAAPYTGIGGEPATLTSKWTMYYASGVATTDFKKGTINFGIQLASDQQVIELGPIFILDFGPDYDQSKLPHNKIVAAAPSTAPSPYSADIAKLQAKLPVKGTLISDPGTAYTYGDALTSSQIDAADLPGGKAMRTVMTKPGAKPWDAGLSAPVTAAMKKGDMIFVAAYIRASEPAPGAQGGVLTNFGVSMAQSPWTAIASLSGMPALPKGQWKLVYGVGVADADHAAGTTNFGMQLGCCQQTLDIGPIYVLNLGQGVDAAKLPKN